MVLEEDRSDRRKVQTGAQGGGANGGVHGSDNGLRAGLRGHDARAAGGGALQGHEVRWAGNDGAALSAGLTSLGLRHLPPLQEAEKQGQTVVPAECPHAETVDWDAITGEKRAAWRLIGERERGGVSCVPVNDDKSGLVFSV